MFIVKAFIMQDFEYPQNLTEELNEFPHAHPTSLTTTFSHSHSFLKKKSS